MTKIYFIFSIYKFSNYDSFRKLGRKSTVWVTLSQKIPVIRIQKNLKRKIVNYFDRLSRLENTGKY